MAKFSLLLGAWLAVQHLLIVRGFRSPTVDQMLWAWDDGENQLSTQEKKSWKNPPKSSRSQGAAIHDVGWPNHPAANEHQSAFHAAHKSLDGADNVSAIVVGSQEGGKYNQPVNGAKENDGDNGLREAPEDVARGCEKWNDHDGGGERRLKNRETIRPHRGSDLLRINFNADFAFTEPIAKL